MMLSYDNLPHATSKNSSVNVKKIKQNIKALHRPDKTE